MDFKFKNTILPSKIKKDSIAPKLAEMTKLALKEKENFICKSAKMAL
nr:hypothetical protein [uncultured Campylobacter sp.]